MNLLKKDNITKSLYVHFPYCRHLCNYCDFYKLRYHSKEQIEQFHHYLVNSWEKLEVLLYEQKTQVLPFETIYLGGGTPSLWGVDGAIFFKKYLLSRGWSLNTNSEFTMEVDPGAWTVEGMEAWREVGVNRFSVGVQSFDPLQLKMLDRSHAFEDIQHLLEYLNKNNLNFSLDLLLGVPPKDRHYVRSIENEINQIKQYAPSHISLYILNVNSSYEHFLKLPKDEFVAREYLEVNKLLEDNHYFQYEVSNYSLKGKEARHNKKYWTHDSILALGPSATGFLDGNLRYKWNASLVNREFKIEHLGKEQLFLEKFYMTLRQRKFFKIEDLFYLEKQKEQFRTILFDWINRGLAISSDEVFFGMLPLGLLSLDSLMQEVFNRIDF